MKTKKSTEIFQQDFITNSQYKIKLLEIEKM